MQPKNKASVSLEDLPVAALEELCAQFTADVLKTAEMLRIRARNKQILDEDPT